MSSLVKSFINRWKFTHAYKKDIDDIINIDYQKELLNAVERKINLDSIK